jgi:hypothetical protein
MAGLGLDRDATSAQGDIGLAGELPGPPPHRTGLNAVSKEWRVEGTEFARKKKLVKCNGRQWKTLGTM